MLKAIAEFIEGLGFSGGAMIVAVISGLVAVAIVRAVISRPTRWILGLTVPLPVAFVFYWMPVWAGNDSSEYSAWAPLFLVPWFLAGAVTSSLALVVVARRNLH